MLYTIWNKGGTEMSNHWNTFMTYIEDKPASIVLDMEPWNDEANGKLTNLYKLNIKLNEPNEYGLTNNKEAEILNAIEGSINESLGRNYINVGRLTTNGIRNIYFYTDSNDENELEKNATKFLENYRFRIKRIEERKPRDFYYEFLYPNEYEQQHMANGQLVNRLIELGDNLKELRKVDHWVYFDSEDSRRKFKEKVKSEGFNIEDQDIQNNRYSLRISRKDSVQLSSINGVTDYLVSVVIECKGEYDGWETKVMKDGKSNN